MIPAPIRVMIDTGNAPPHGGVGVFSSGLTRALQESEHRRVAVCESGASHASLRWRALARADYFMRIRRVRKTAGARCDLLHFTNALVPRGPWNVKVVSTVHDFDPVRFPELYPPKYRLYARHAILNALRRADIVHTVSETTRQLALEAGKLEETRVRRIWIGVSQQMIASAGTKPMATSGPPMLLFVGALLKKKNLAWLVREVTAGVERGAIPRVQLVLAGNRSYGYSEIVREINRSDGTARHVENPPLEELVGLYRAASVVILPSFVEGFGLPLIEGMMFDKQIVASRIPSSVEVGGEVPWFFDLGSRDGLYHALNCALQAGSTERQALRRERLKCFLWPALVPEYEKLYEDGVAR